MISCITLTTEATAWNAFEANINAGHTIPTPESNWSCSDPLESRQTYYWNMTTLSEITVHEVIIILDFFYVAGQ